MDKMRKAVNPTLKRQLEADIKKNTKEIRDEGKKTVKKIISGMEKYKKAVDAWKAGKSDVRSQRINEVLRYHKDYVSLVKKLIFKSTIDSLQLTDSLELEAINKENRGYADGYLSHYSQALNRLKELRGKI